MTDRDVLRLRVVANRRMPDTASILRVTSTDDGMGGATDTWNTVVTAPCRVTPDESFLVAGVGEAGIRDATRWIISTPAGTDVRRADRVTVNGLLYQVEDIVSGASYEVERRVQAILLDQVGL